MYCYNPIDVVQAVSQQRYVSILLSVSGPCDEEACGLGVIAVGMSWGMEFLSWGWEREGNIQFERRSLFFSMFVDLKFIGLGKDATPPVYRPIVRSDM